VEIANSSVVMPGLSQHFAGDKERESSRWFMTNQLIYRGNEFTNQPTIECAVGSYNCDKFGHPLARDLVLFTTKAPNCRYAPRADRFGHLCGPRDGISGEVRENALGSKSGVIGKTPLCLP
jgi:hypothetical protein